MTEEEKLSKLKHLVLEACVVVSSLNDYNSSYERTKNQEMRTHLHGVLTQVDKSLAAFEDNS